MVLPVVCRVLIVEYCPLPVCVVCLFVVCSGIRCVVSVVCCVVFVALSIVCCLFVGWLLRVVCVVCSALCGV